MTRSEASNPYIPELRRARAEGVPLPDGDPIVEERWSALFVIATILRRRTWKEEVTMHPQNVAHIGRGAPPAPPGYAAATNIAVESIGESGACPDCSRHPGKRQCRVCHGYGQMKRDGGPGFLKCSCNNGFILCPTCRGEGSAARIGLRYFEDAPRSMREFWLPSHLAGYQSLFRLERTMEAAVDLALEPPEALRCQDLSGRTAGTAYRGGERLVRPTFHGHDYGDTIDRALESLKALGGGMQVIHYDIRAYAWPLLRLSYPHPKEPPRTIDVALYADRNGKMCAFWE
jgi:hypothetical protein